MSGKKLRVLRGIFCAIHMKHWSNGDDHLVDMQQKIGEFGGEREERKKRKCNLFTFIAASVNVHI